MKGFGSPNNQKKINNSVNLTKEQIVSLAIKYHSQGNISQATKYYKYCIENNINEERVFSNYGIILRSLNKLHEAENLLKKYIYLNPSSVITHNNLSGILKELGRYKEAENILKKSLEIDPNNANSLYNFGCLMIDLKNYKEAELFFRKSISLNPTNNEAYLNLGIVMRNLGQLDEALVYISKALKIKPNNALGFLNKGIVYRELEDYKLALECFYKANKIESVIPSIKYEILTCKGLICDWNNITDIDNWVKNLGLSGESVNPLDFFLYDDNPLNHLKRSKNFFNQHHKRKEVKIGSRKNCKIRIGYFSADFKVNHPLMNLFPSIITSHDRNKFEIYIYSFTPNEDKFTHVLKNLANVFRDIKNLSEDQTIKTVREDNLDIAVDLMGYTSNSRTYIFSNKVAPIQVSYLGYPGTMGSRIYDYILGDEIIIPKKFEKFYTEKVMKLSNFFPPNLPASEVFFEKVTREEFNLPSNAFVFTCFNHNKKITKREFDIWMRLLNEVQDSVLWLQKSNNFSIINLKKEAIQRNVNPKRLIFANKLKSLKRHLARYSLGDLGLDTFNYNGHTTTSDALNSGLPVLTKIGKSFSARVSASILNSINLNEFITTNESAYENKALYFARNRDELNKTKNLLYSLKNDSSLSNAKEYTKDLEKIYLEIISSKN